MIAARFAQLADLSPDQIAALHAAEGARRRVAPHRELVSEDQPSGAPAILAAGWACRTRQFTDGRRQIVNLFVPGDMIGRRGGRGPVAPTTIVALTECLVCPAPEAAQGSALAEAYAVCGAFEELQLVRQIARLGRLNAQERVVDWLLDLHERLQVTGHATGNDFALPVTQEMLADALGLTSVHVNRTLQALRRDGLLTLRSGIATLGDIDRLRSSVDFRPAYRTLASSAMPRTDSSPIATMKLV